MPVGSKSINVDPRERSDTREASPDIAVCPEGRVSPELRAVAKIDASMPLVEETAAIRRKAMEIQYGNRIAYLEAQTRLVEQQNERTVQQRKENYGKITVTVLDCTP